MEKFNARYRVVLAVALIALILPLLFASAYNRFSGDDFPQAAALHGVYLAGGSVSELISAAVKDTITSYNTWSGLFVQMFLVRFTPVFASLTLAYIHPALLMALLFGSVFVLLRTAGRRFQVKPVYVHSAALLLCIQFIVWMPSVPEGIYWFAGGVAYTFAFSFSLLMYALYLSWGLTQHTRKGSVIQLVVLCLGSFLLCPTNFSTGTVSVVLYACFTAYLLLKRKNWLSLLPLVFLLIGYALPVLAPGNDYRYLATGQTGGNNLVETFFLTFRNTFNFIFIKNPTVPLFTLLFLPLMIPLSEQFKDKCRRPLLVLLFSFAVLAAGFIAPIHAIRSNGDDRLLNVQFFLLCMFYALNFFYIICYIRRRFDVKAETNPKAARRFFSWFTALVSAVLLLSTMSNMRINPVMFRSEIPSVKAVSRLLDGTLKTYTAEYDEMMTYIQAHPGEDIVLTHLPSSGLFYDMAITDDPDNWYNEMIVEFLGVRSIVYQPPAEE